MGDYTVKIDVTNMSSHSPIRSGSYSMKVPFASLSQTIQFIHRAGGKVVEVTKLSTTATLAESPPLTAPAPNATTNSKPQSPAATVARTEQKSTQDRSKRGGKNNKR